LNSVVIRVALHLIWSSRFGVLVPHFKGPAAYIEQGQKELKLK
jgi:hypothetical protein